MWKLSKKVRFWATQAREPFPYYEHKEIGYNYRMSNIVAGIGRGQMHHIGEHIAQKRAIYHRYKEGFTGVPVEMNPYVPCSEPNFWLSCFTINKGQAVTPDDIRLELAKYNIESRPIWKPMHLQPVYAANDFITLDDPVGEDIFARGLCLPSDNKMTEEQQQVVIEIIDGLFK
ncbi:DegT/DnrJ/EryC1/StrS family aminotransferase [Megasphaera paucivorans]|uniref:DegT/DnrJ/EryC1/StrS family aminotransferase n=1 Tax=Megasphaera paucivorans TaxID=349095 RepID=UPI002481BDDC|nr:DegT/DnrJ/EryC1/StrS family aminotransferase [Megasphaera paucivorans]